MNEESIFAVALQKSSAADRQAYLDEACAGQPDLRAQVEELLQASDDAGSFLNHAPLGVDVTIAATNPEGDTEKSATWTGTLPFLDPCDTPGRIGRLDHYEIIELVGHGGMGAVLRAFDTKLSRVVAVKVMAPELAANPTAVKRFLREAKAAAAVHHDHVVTIHAIEEMHRPPYLVMQFIEGQTLQQKIDKEGALELAEILRIGSQAAAGLAAAHKLGLIHRDVKPANILLENGVERVKITDFGLARAADDVEVTQTGIIAGTPQYMSPEQARGEVMDARGDLFSLGSVLYTMCTGRPAFRAETTMGVLKRVCEDAPRPIREVNAEIPAWLEAIVTRLLAKNPAERFESAAEVAEQLSQHLAHLQNPAQVPRPATVGLPPVAAPPYAPARSANGSATAMLLILAIVVLGLPVALLGLSFVAWYLYAGAERPDLGQINSQFGSGGSSGSMGGSSRTLPGDWNRSEIIGIAGTPTDWPHSTEGFLQLAANASSFEPIFNGQDLTGWMQPPGAPPAWQVEDGVLVGRGAYSYLVSMRRDYRDFHLRAELRINDGGNSGLYFRAELPADWKTHGCIGYEAEITGTDEEGKTGSLRRYPQPAVLAQVEEPLVPAGEWFTYEVIAVGNRLETLVNGQPAASVIDDTHAQGGIALQLIREDTTVVEFRKIELKELMPASQFAASGWTSLFNGQNLAGWRAQSGSWTVKDGAIVGRGRNHYLYSERADYQDFWLRAEVKLGAKADGGLLVRMAAPSEGPAAESGYEVQLAGDPANASPTASIIRHGRQEGGQRVKGRGDLIQADQWSVLDIAAIGPTLTVAIDGQTVASYRDDRPRPSGHIALQAFSEAAEVSFRKIEINELKPAKDWTPLFDGRSLAGWTPEPGKTGWKAEYGRLVGSGSAGFLTSDKEYGDFHLKARVRISADGDSGIYFRCQPDSSLPRGVNTGYEAQVIGPGTDSNRTGSLYKFDRGLTEDVWQQAENTVEADEWFDYEIIARQGRIELKVNGRTLADYTDPQPLTKGRLALDLFQDRGRVEFEKIEIKEPPPEGPPPTVKLATWGKFVDPRGECSQMRTGRILSIRVPGTHPYNLLPLEGFNLDAPRLVQELEGDFLIQATVMPYEQPKPNTSSRPGRPVSFRAAGLLVWVNEQTFLRFERASYGESGEGTPYLNMEWYNTGQPGRTGDAARPMIPSAPTHLQIERRGQVLYLRRSDDGRRWTDVNAVHNLNLPQHVSVGLVASNSTNTDFTAEFHNIRLRSQEGTSDLGQVPALRELVAARQQSAATVKVQFDEGKVTAQELTAVEVEVLEARIRLAEAESSPAAVVELLKELVAKLTEQRRLVQQRVENGFEPPAALTDADAAVADAKARLAKAEAAASLK